MRSTRGAVVGGVNDTAMRMLIGLEPILPELGTKSNHFSSASLVNGTRRFCREIQVIPIAFEAPFIGILEGE